MNFGNPYLVSIVFGAVFVLGLLSKIIAPGLWDWFGVVDTASAVATVAVAGFGYREYLRLEDEIKILFDIEGELTDTGLTLLRRNFSRQELMGVLGMIQKNQKERFNVESLHDIAVLRKIHEIQKGKGKSFVIKMSKEEKEQFRL